MSHPITTLLQRSNEVPNVEGAARRESELAERFPGVAEAPAARERVRRGFPTAEDLLREARKAKR